MPPSGRPQHLLLQFLGVAQYLCERRVTRRLLRVVSDVRGVFLPRSREIRFLRSLQVYLWRQGRESLKHRLKIEAQEQQMFPNANKTIVYLGASASAEFLADIALCPFEAIKVRMQTTLPPYASTMREGWGKITAKEGIGGLYKGLQPLWGRQIPYTMVKFATFEKTVEQIYKYLGKPKESYNALQQTGVSFLGGYIAGVGCAVVSHPADVMVSKLNADRQRKFPSSTPYALAQGHWLTSHTHTAGESGGKAMSRIYGNIGFRGLWNGLSVRIAMVSRFSSDVVFVCSHKKADPNL